MPTLPAPLQLPTTAMQPNSTKNIAAQFNLDSRSITPTATPFDATNSSTYNYANAVTVYDSLGNSHELSTFFSKTASNTWDVYATADGKPLATGGAMATAVAPATPTAEEIDIAADGYIHVRHGSTALQPAAGC